MREEVDVDIGHEEEVVMDFCMPVRWDISSAQSEQQTGITFFCLDSLVNCDATPRTGVDIRLEAILWLWLPRVLRAELVRR